MFFLKKVFYLLLNERLKFKFENFMSYSISGIQQLGIGLSSLKEGWHFYKEHFGMNIPLFNDEAEAKLMTPYTGGEVHKRQAILALHTQGGGGFELWQFKSRKPQKSKDDLLLGDLGINAGKIKVLDIEKCHKSLLDNGLNVSDIHETPCGQHNFYLLDSFKNIFEFITFEDWFKKGNQNNGGVCGAVIGCSNIENSLKVYQDILGFTEVIFDTTSIFPEFEFLLNGGKKFRRVKLKHPQPKKGAFGNFLGDTELELIQAIDYEGKKIYQDRFWGDVGFIHLCFDVVNMDKLKEKAEKNGHPFTVDSAESFDMGDAQGHFSYIEDPDGTLIEFVETYKVPVLKKLGWFVNLSNRDRSKNLPNWLMSALALNKFANPNKTF